MQKIRSSGTSNYPDNPEQAKLLKQVKEILKREVIKDKKAEKLMAKLKGVNS